MSPEKSHTLFRGKKKGKKKGSHETCPLQNPEPGSTQGYAKALGQQWFYNYVRYASLK